MSKGFLSHVFIQTGDVKLHTLEGKKKTQKKFFKLSGKSANVRIFEGAHV